MTHHSLAQRFASYDLSPHSMSCLCLPCWLWTMKKTLRSVADDRLKDEGYTAPRSNRRRKA